MSRIKCPECGGPLNIKNVLPVGRVLSLTTLNFPPEGFEPPLHFVFVQVKGRVRILARMEKPFPVSIGDWMEMEKKGDLFFAKPSTYGKIISMKFSRFLVGLKGIRKKIVRVGML